MSEKQARELFAQFSVDEKLQLPEFVEILSPFKTDVSKQSYALLYLAADADKKGFLTEDDWLKFVRTLSSPDGEYKLLFNLFSKGKSQIAYNDALNELNNLNKAIDPSYQQKKAKFNWSYFSMFFEPSGQIKYSDFVTLINYLPITKLIGSFEVMAGKSAVISGDEMVELFQRNLNHKLSSKLKNSLSTLPKFFEQDKFTIANVLFVYNALSKLDIVNEVLANSPPTSKDKDDILINKADLYNHLQDHLLKSSNFSPVSMFELDLLYYLVGKGTETIPRRELVSIFNPNFENNEKQLYSVFEHPAAQPVVDDNFSLWPIFDSLYSFFLGSIAGCIGATVVYPIDLVKTRMQAQRHNAAYKNSLDCFKKIVSKEGLKGLYSGLAAQLVGVAPEKAIKLTVNDLIRKIGTDDNGQITMNWEILAGMSAGGCQVIFTNPLEIVKIRLQMQGNQKQLAEGSIPHKKLTAGQIVRILGIKGLYKGASACLLRDVPFSAIYFPTYANLKKVMFGFDPNDLNSKHRLDSWQLLVAGALAGAPSAFFTTPADVIKTRLQIEQKTGETKYNGIRHAARVILKEEGLSAFFKGSLARVFRSSPQFGFTLASYEILQNLFPLHPPMTKESNFKTIAGYPGVYSLTNDQVYSQNERMMYFNPSDFKTPQKPNGVNDALVKVPAQLVYKSQDAIKLLLDIDYKFGNFNYGNYLNMIGKK